MQCSVSRSPAEAAVDTEWPGRDTRRLRQVLLAPLPVPPKLGTDTPLATCTDERRRAFAVAAPATLPVAPMSPSLRSPAMQVTSKRYGGGDAASYPPCDVA